MFIKTLTWSRFYPLGLMRYISDPDKVMEADYPIFYNITKPTFQGALDAFKENHTYRNIRKNSVMTHHDILSFSPKDQKHLNAEKLRDLTYQYLKLRAEDNLAYAHIHKDKDHFHVHIMYSPNPYKTRNVTHVSKSRYSEIQREMEYYQRKTYPELENSFVYHKQSKEVSKYIPQAEFEMRKRGEPLKRDEIKKLVSIAFDKAHSPEEFYSLTCQIEGAEIFTRGGKNYGIIIKEQKYKYSTLLGMKVNEFQSKLQEKENSIVNRLLAQAKTRSQQKGRGRGRSFER